MRTRASRRAQGSDPLPIEPATGDSLPHQSAPRQGETAGGEAAPGAEFDRHALYYDVEHADYLGDIPMYVGFAGASGDGSVLELACGTGRCLLPLAAVGHHVTGVDLSNEMLRLAGAKAQTAGLEAYVQLHQGDMRSVTLGRTFGLVIIALNSLMHLQTREEQLQALRCAAAHLAPDGRLVLDVFNPEVVLPEPEQEGQLFLHCFNLLPHGVHLLHFQSPRVDRAAQVVSMMNYYDELNPDGAVRRYLAPFNLRYLTRGEFELLIDAAGLDLEALYGSYELDPFESGSAYMIATARLRTS